MKKDTNREEAAAAFRRYARLGLDRLSTPTAVLLRIRGVCGDAEAFDLLAAADALRLLEFSGRTAAAAAVRAVYMRGVRGRLHAGDIRAAVLRTAGVLHCDERTVYRYLAEARAMWRRLRELYEARGADEILGTRPSF